VSSAHREGGRTTLFETEAPWDLGPGPSESVTLKLVRVRVERENKICYIRPNIEWTPGPQGFSTLNPILFITLPAFNYEQDLISETSSLSCGDIKGRFHPTTLQNKKKFSMPTPLLKCPCALCRYPHEILFSFHKNISLTRVTDWLQAL